jgi:hypothetical protein
MSVEDDPQFERWLDRELGSAVRSVRGPCPRAEQAAYRASGRRGVVSAPGRLAAGVALAIVAIIAGGVLAVAAYTGSPNPAEWAPVVVRVVSGCGWDIAPDGRHVRDLDNCVDGRERNSESPAPSPASPAPPPRATPAGPVSLHETEGDPSETANYAAASGEPATDDSSSQGDGGHEVRPPPGHSTSAPEPRDQQQESGSQDQGSQDQGSKGRQSKDEQPEQ